MEFLGKKTSKQTLVKNPNKTSKSKKKKIPIKKGPWLYEEDILLKKWVEENGPKNWWICAKTIPGRNSRQCSQHWHTRLKPNLSVGNWTSKEIFLIMVFYKKFNGSWKKMIPIFKSRTKNSIKNIFYSQIRTISKLHRKKEDKKENENVGLDYLLKYYDIALEQIKKKFLKDNPMTENELEDYIKNIEIMVKNKPNEQTYIYLDKLEKPNNNINISYNNKIAILNESDDEQEDDDINDNDSIYSLNKNNKQQKKQKKNKLANKKEKSNKKNNINKKGKIIRKEKTYNAKKIVIKKQITKDTKDKIKNGILKKDEINNFKIEEELKFNNENKSKISELNKGEIKNQNNNSPKANSCINKNENKEEKIIKNEINSNKRDININNNDHYYPNYNYNNDLNNNLIKYCNIDYNNLLNNINNTWSLNKQNNNIFINNYNNNNIAKLNEMNFYNSLSNNSGGYFPENTNKTPNEIIDNNMKLGEFGNSKKQPEFSNAIDSNNILDNNNSLYYLKFGAIAPNYFLNNGKINFNNGIMNKYINGNIYNIFPTYQKL